MSSMCGIGISAVKSQIGLVIKSVEANGAAGRSGLILAGDIIISCNGTPCRTLTPLQLKPLVVGPAGSEVVLELERGGRPLASPIRLVRAPIDDPQEPFIAHSAAAQPYPLHFNTPIFHQHSSSEPMLPPASLENSRYDTTGSSLAPAAAMPGDTILGMEAQHHAQYQPPKPYPTQAPAHSEEPLAHQHHFHQHQQLQQNWHVQPQQLPHQPQFQEPTADPSTSQIDAEQELSLLLVAIDEAETRQTSLKEDIAAVNAEIAAATKALNVKRDRVTDLQQVCASLQQGHAGLKTVLAEAAQLPFESEGVEKMRARLFLVQSNGHKARQAIQVVQGELDHMREQAKAGVEERQRLAKEIAVIAHSKQQQQQRK